MNTRLITGFVVSVALLLSGCVTGNRVWPEGTLAPADDQSHLQRVHIESRPSGALFVLNGRVVGHAPLDIQVPATRHGFCPNRMTIRATFLAEDQSFGPVSVLADFGPLAKVPYAVVFTPETFWPMENGRM